MSTSRVKLSSGQVIGRISRVRERVADTSISLPLPRVGTESHESRPVLGSLTSRSRRILLPKQS